MTKILLFSFILLLIVSFSYFIYANAKQTPSYTPGRWPEADTAINQSKFLFQTIKASGRDISSGPCLSNALMPDWVADLVHNPRQPIDNMTENQCQSYVNGSVKHYVELDLNGDLVRVK